MERVYSHSKPPAFSSKKKPPPSSSFHHHNHNNNGGFFSTTTTSYDDVFGGPPKFASSSSLAPRAEDYSEIFGGFRLSSTSSSSRASSSSIPVLDLPAVPDDIGAAFFDYSEVFGGFNAVDFAVPFDKLFRPCDGSFIDDDDDDDDDDAHGHGGDGDGDGGVSSDEAWTPVGTDSLSDDSDPFASSEKSQHFSSINPHQQSESKQFNVSYHKVNPGTSSYTPNTMHVTQLNDMPGYTCVVDEATTLREIGNESCSPVIDDTQEITRKTWSHASDDSSGLKAYNSDPSSGRPCGASISHMNPTFASISDINLRTKPSHLPPPSRPPPVVADQSGDISDLSLGPGAAEKCVFEETIDCGLPPFFDMEVDASSFAAASAAAVEDAMEKAQAKMKTAKQSRDRKDRIQNSGKLHFDTDSNGGENIQRPLDESLSGETRVHTSDRGPSKIKNNVKARHTKSTSQNLLNILAVDQLTGVSEKPARTKQGKRNSSSSDNALTDAAGQWKEAQQYYEFVNNENTQPAPQTHSSEGDVRTATMHQGDDDNSDSGGEPCVTGENRRRLKVTKAVSRQEYYEKMVKVAQEVHVGVNCGHVGPDKKLKHMLQGNSRQQKPELVSEQEMLEIPLCRSQEMQETPGEAVWKEKSGNRSNNILENEEEESEACHSDQVDKNVNGIESMVEDASSVSQGNFRGSCNKYEVDYSVQDTVGRGCEQIAQESHGRPRVGSRLEEASKPKMNKEAREMAYKRSMEASEGVFIGDRMQTARGSEENNANDLQRMRAADERLEEVLEYVSGTETLQTGESLENNMMRNLQQRDGYENHVGEAVDGQGSKRTLEKCVKQDKCEDDKKVPGQEIGRQRLYEDLIVDSKNSEGEKQDIEKVKPEKATELEHVEHTFLQACEMDKLWCKLEEAVDGQGSKKTLNRSVKLENNAKNTEVSEQPIRTERLNEAHDLIVDNKNSVEFQGQHEKKKKLEKTTKPKQESLKGCELRETRRMNESTDDKGLYRSHIKFEWQDEDQVPSSFSYMELPMEDNYVNSSNETNLYKDNEQDISCKLTKPQRKGEGFRVVTAQKEHDEIGLTSSDEKSKLEPVKSADVLIKEKQIESDAAQVVSEDSELEGRTSKASDTVDLNENNIGSACDRTEQTREKEKKEVSPLTSDSVLGKDNNIGGGRKRNLAEGQVLFDQEEKVKSILEEGIHGCNGHASKEEVTQTVFPEEKERFQKTSHLPKVGQSFERKGKDIDHNCSSEDKDVEKERDLEKERLQTLEEERERLREREKDRMAVEMTIREARDRAYADARDRAERASLERATDDARQRAMTEARERLEKACAEAREKSLADREARLRAERAAVERATAEARQRAFEKAMAERTTFEARERMQRSVSEKYSSEREVIMRQSSFPTSNERFETANSEPAERCKARLERHRRTVERVAKALAEKNMRDLVAQREQAERTRLAETLDADIRRWSSGKEGNLRALLSTLQYILGPDSGWHPIPLTEVITAAAVKKAYRKATLCVHPDKLQQRGASIQQKYICEKVFDLLKEAWNRFNSEEK